MNLENNVISRRSARKLTPLLVLSFFAACGIAAQAQGDQTIWVAKRLLGFVNTGGYFLTDPTGRAMLGSPKFYNHSAYYVRPKHIGDFTLRGGIEIISASDHLLPFEGGNFYDLTGFSGEISTLKRVLRPRYYLSGGLFFGEIRSVNLNFDRSAITPSMGFGIELPLTKSLSINTGYRLSQKISGYNTDGFVLNIQLH